MATKNSINSVASSAEVNILDGATLTTTELNYVDGVTSDIQTQLNGKAASLGADENYVTDAQLVVIGNTSGTNTGDQTNITGNAATVTTNANLTGHVTSTGNAAVLGSFTLAQLNTAVSDANIIPEAGGTFTGDISVPDEAYGAGWNGSAEVPTKNAVYDKIETISGGSGLTQPQVMARSFGGC